MALSDGKPTHRSFFRVCADPALVIKVRARLYFWLCARGWTAAELTDDGPVDLAPGVVGSYLHSSDDDGNVTERYHIVDHNIRHPGTDTCVTEFTVRCDSHADGWVWTDLYGPTDRDHAAPALVHEVLNVVVGRDGDHPLDPTVQFAGEGDVDTILTMLHDRRRRGPLYLAGSSELRNPSGDIPLSRWRDYAEQVLAGTRGVANGFVLDHLATDALNERLSRTHRLVPWTLRTYLPLVDVDDPNDALRHRFLTTTRIVSSDIRTLRPTFTRNARLATLTAPLPADAIEMDELFRGRRPVTGDRGPRHTDEAACLRTQLAGR